MNNRALIAMSGGVDSSVSAYLMVQAGFECVGANMKLYTADIIEEGCKTCCSLEDAEDARSVCYKLGMKFHVFNFSESLTVLCPATKAAPPPIPALTATNT